MPPSAPEISEDTASEGNPEETDVVVVHGITADGAGLRVLRHREDKIEAGAVRPVEQGKPIYGELVRLRPRASCPLVCDVTVELPAASRQPDDDVAATPEACQRKGPAQVASNRYRANWDTIWSRN